MSVPLSLSVLVIWSFVLWTQNTDPSQCSMVQWPITQHLETFVCNNVSVLLMLLDQNLRVPWDSRKMKSNIFLSHVTLWDSPKTCKSLKTGVFFSLIIYAFTCGFSSLEQNAIIITRWVPIYWYHCRFSIFVETNRRSPTYLLHHFNLHLMLEFAYNSFDSKYGSDPFWSRTQLWCMGCCQAWWLCPACKYPVIYMNHHFIFHLPS